nr:SDR family NAD(P)-dependent oxidoreductase [Myxococcus guangdongensis]
MASSPTSKGLGRLKDRVALVTGGDSGIGRAVCLAFAREGADVAVSFLSEGDDARQVQHVVEDAGRSALLSPGDLAVEATCRELVEQMVRRFGRIDALVNNAALRRSRSWTPSGWSARSASTSSRCSTWCAARCHT